MSIDNTVHIRGMVYGNPKRLPGTNIYKLELHAKRHSEYVDKVNIKLPQKYAKLVKNGDFVEVAGECRSRNEGGHHYTAIDADRIELSEEIYLNEIELRGTLCRQPNMKHTRSGKTVCEFMLAARRCYYSTDYVPCIAWGYAAESISRMVLGTEMEVKGRLQSRDYVKKNEDGEERQRTVHEVSIYWLNVLEKEDQKGGQAGAVI